VRQALRSHQTQAGAADAIQTEAQVSEIIICTEDAKSFVVSTCDIDLERIPWHFGNGKHPVTFGFRADGQITLNFARYIIACRILGRRPTRDEQVYTSHPEDCRRHSITIVKKC
jgi:hypothetical protein